MQGAAISIVIVSNNASA